MNLPRIRFLCIEIYKVINGLNPDFIEKIEIKKINRIVRDRYKLNLNIPRTNQLTFFCTFFSCCLVNLLSQFRLVLQVTVTLDAFYLH